MIYDAQTHIHQISGPVKWTNQNWASLACLLSLIPLSFTGASVIFIRIPLMNLTIGVQCCNMNMTKRPTYFQYHLMQVTSHWLLLHFVVSFTPFFFKLIWELMKMGYELYSMPTVTLNNIGLCILEIFIVYIIRETIN